MGMFGLGAEEIDALNQKQNNATAMGLANMAPGRVGVWGAGMLGLNAADALKEGFGIQDPMKKKANLIKEAEQEALSTGAEFGTPQFFNAASASLMKRGLNNEAYAVRSYATEMVGKQADATAKIAKATKDARGVGDIDVSKFDPASVERYKLTGNYSDLKLGANDKNTPEYRKMMELRAQGMSDADSLNLAYGNTQVVTDPVQGSSSVVTRVPFGGGGGLAPAGTVGIGAPDFKGLQGDPQQILAQIMQIPDPQDRAGALAQYQKQLQPGMGRQVTPGGRQQAGYDKNYEDSLVDAVWKPTIVNSQAAEKQISVNQKLRALLSKTETGKFAPLKAEAQAYARAMGFDLGDPTDMQSLQTGLNEAILATQIAQKGPQTEADARRIQQSFIQAGNMKEANQFILDYSDALARRDIEKRSFLQRYRAENGKFDGGEEAWQKKISDDDIFDLPQLKKYKSMMEKQGTSRFEEGKVYRDANGNRALYQGGKFIPQ